MADGLPAYTTLKCHLTVAFTSKDTDKRLPSHSHPRLLQVALAFDLYPLLRTEEWLTKFEGHAIYRETRAQELVDLLWSHPDSPWHHRINMLGEKGTRGTMVTQASWVRSLMASFVKTWEARRTPIGGLFGSTIGEHKTVLDWTRPDQAAFLILLGRLIQDAIRSSDELWMQALRESPYSANTPTTEDFAFLGPDNLLNSDQGVRAILQVANDLCFINADDLDLHGWGGTRYHEESDFGEITNSINSLKKQPTICSFLDQLSTQLATYDWRSSRAPSLSDEARIHKAAFRGSGGYKELRRDVLLHLAQTQGVIGRSATDVIVTLGY